MSDPDGKLTLWSSTQTPHYVHRALAKVLGMPAAHIRVIATPNGGGFGGKSDPFNHEIVVGEGRADPRPPREDLPDARGGLLLPPRAPSGADAVPNRREEGRRDHGAALADAARRRRVRFVRRRRARSTRARCRRSRITIPTYRFAGCRVFTNKPPCGPKRGHGTPQRRFGQEVQLDKIAESLGDRSGAISAAASSRRPNTLTANFLRVGTIGLGECIETRRRGVGLDATVARSCRPRARTSASRARPISRGAGLPIYWNDMPHSGVQLKVDRSGGVTAFCGATEIGQGSDDVLAAMRRGGARASIRSTSAPSPATRT